MKDTEEPAMWVPEHRMPGEGNCEWKRTALGRVLSFYKGLQRPALCKHGKQRENGRCESREMGQQVLQRLSRKFKGAAGGSSLQTK